MEYIAPDQIKIDQNKLKVFLGGSIDNGSTIDWQSQVAKQLTSLDIDVYNPRCKNWNKDASENELEEQIKWELDAQEKATIRLYYFVDGSLSPITLLELGLFGSKQYTFVCCSPKFWRYTNIQITCSYLKIPLFTTLDEVISHIMTFNQMCIWSKFLKNYQEKC
jgi:hypothetical protein